MLHDRGRNCSAYVGIADELCIEGGVQVRRVLRKARIAGEDRGKGMQYGGWEGGGGEEGIGCTSQRKSQEGRGGERTNSERIESQQVRALCMASPCPTPRSLPPLRTSAVTATLSRVGLHLISSHIISFIPSLCARCHAHVCANCQHLPETGGRVRAGRWGGSGGPVLDRCYRLAAPGGRDLRPAGALAAGHLAVCLYVEACVYMCCRFGVALACEKARGGVRGSREGRGGSKGEKHLFWR